MDSDHDGGRQYGVLPGLEIISCREGARGVVSRLTRTHMDFNFSIIFKTPFRIQVETVPPAALAEINTKLDRLIETGDALAKAEKILAVAKENSADLAAAAKVEKPTQ